MVPFLFTIIVEVSVPKFTRALAVLLLAMVVPCFNLYAEPSSSEENDAVRLLTNGTPTLADLQGIAAYWSQKVSAVPYFSPVFNQKARMQASINVLESWLAENDLGRMCNWVYDVRPAPSAKVVKQCEQRKSNLAPISLAVEGLKTFLEVASESQWNQMYLMFVLDWYRQVKSTFPKEARRILEGAYREATHYGYPKNLRFNTLSPDPEMELEAWCCGHLPNAWNLAWVAGELGKKQEENYWMLQWADETMLCPNVNCDDQKTEGPNSVRHFYAPADVYSIYLDAGEKCHALLAAKLEGDAQIDLPLGSINITGAALHWWGIANVPMSYICNRLRQHYTEAWWVPEWYEMEDAEEALHLMGCEK